MKTRFRKTLVARSRLIVFVTEPAAQPPAGVHIDRTVGLTDYSQTKVVGPTDQHSGSATSLKYSCINHLPLSSDSHNLCLCSVLCSPHDFVSLVNHRPDLLQVGMLVQTSNVHFAMPMTSITAITLSVSSITSVLNLCRAQ